jgi:hypothetical protein
MYSEIELSHQNAVATTFKHQLNSLHSSQDTNRLHQVELLIIETILLPKHLEENV